MPRSSNGEGGGSVAHGRVPHAATLVGLVVVEELEAHNGAVGDAAHGGDGAKEDADGMATTDGVAKLFEVLCEAFVVQILKKFGKC